MFTMLKLRLHLLIGVHMKKVSSKIKQKVEEDFSKPVEFSLPMLIGILVVLFLLFCFDALGQEIDSDVKDILKSDVGDRTCLVMNLYHESRSESDMANIMVLNSVFNRVNSKHYPSTPCGVIKQKHQYSWTSDKRSDVMKDTKQVKRLTLLVDKYIINKELFLSMSQGVDHYHHVSITPEWSASKRMLKVATVDQHVFYKRK